MREELKHKIGKRVSKSAAIFTIKFALIRNGKTHLSLENEDTGQQETALEEHCIYITSRAKIRTKNIKNIITKQTTAELNNVIISLTQINEEMRNSFSSTIKELNTYIALFDEQSLENSKLKEKIKQQEEDISNLKILLQDRKGNPNNLINRFSGIEVE